MLEDKFLKSLFPRKSELEKDHDRVGVVMYSWFPKFFVSWQKKNMFAITYLVLDIILILEKM